MSVKKGSSEMYKKFFSWRVEKLEAKGLSEKEIEDEIARKSFEETSPPAKSDDKNDLRKDLRLIKK